MNPAMWLLNKSQKSGFALLSRPTLAIYVKPGTYRESLRLSAAVNIIGDGPQQSIIIKRVTGSCIHMDTATASVRNLTLRGSANDPYAVFIPTGELVLEDCDISSDQPKGGACVAIRGDNAKPIIRRCVIHDGKADGIDVGNNGSGQIDQCDIYGNKSSGMWISDGNPTVRNCQVHDNESQGIYIISNGVGVFEQCDIYSNKSSGIYISDGNPTVRNCKIHDSKMFGVSVNGNSSGTFENCELRGNEKGNWNIAAGCQVTRRNNRE